LAAPPTPKNQFRHLYPLPEMEGGLGRVASTLKCGVTPNAIFMDIR
jgi:hypothetical protein